MLSPSFLHFSLQHNRQTNANNSSSCSSARYPLISHSDALTFSTLISENSELCENHVPADIKNGTAGLEILLSVLVKGGKNSHNFLLTSHRIFYMNTSFFFCPHNLRSFFIPPSMKNVAPTKKYRSQSWFFRGFVFRHQSWECLLFSHNILEERE